MTPGTKITISKGQFSGMEGIIQDSETEIWTGVRRNKRTGKITDKVDHSENKVWVWIVGENLRVLIDINKCSI